MSATTFPSLAASYQIISVPVSVVVRSEIFLALAAQYVCIVSPVGASGVSGCEPIVPVTALEIHPSLFLAVIE